MTPPMIPHDKANHVIYGAAITPICVEAVSATGFALAAQSGGTKGQARFVPLAGCPSDRQVGALAVIYATVGSTDARTATSKLFYADGADWRYVADDTVFNG